MPIEMTLHPEDAFQTRRQVGQWDADHRRGLGSRWYDPSSGRFQQWDVHHRRGVGVVNPEDYFQTRRQMGQYDPMFDPKRGGYPLEGPVPGDPDYVPESGSPGLPAPDAPAPTATVALPERPVPSLPPTTTTEEPAWYENPWVLGAGAVAVLLLLAYAGGAFGDMDESWDDLGDCGCGK